MLLGAHISGSGKIYLAFERAKDLGCNTIQIFSRNPQRWRESALTPEDIREFNKIREQSSIKPVFIHIPYLINLASPNRSLYRASVRAYIEDIKEAAALGVDYIVTHMGSHKETSEPEGLKRLSKALNIIFKETSLMDVGILLENTSGSGSWLGYKFSHQKKVMQEVENKSRLGLCLDTAHAYSAGYNLSTKPGLDKLLGEIDALVGLERVKLIHLNDTKERLGSLRDTHFHIGQGNIGLAGMKRIINHPEFKNKAFILETPKDRHNRG